MCPTATLAELFAAIRKEAPVPRHLALGMAEVYDGKIFARRDPNLRVMELDEQDHNVVFAYPRLRDTDADADADADDDDNDNDDGHHVNQRVDVRSNERRMSDDDLEDGYLEDDYEEQALERWAFVFHKGAVIGKLRAADPTCQVITLTRTSLIRAWISPTPKHHHHDLN